MVWDRRLAALVIGGFMSWPYLARTENVSLEIVALWGIWFTIGLVLGRSEALDRLS